MNIEVVENKKYPDRWKRTFRINPQPKYMALLKAMTEQDDRKRVGDTVKDIIKKHFDSLPPDQRARLIEQSKHHY